MNAPASERGDAVVTEVSDPGALGTRPLVSVLMLAYNHGPYLAQAIDSVLSQRAEFAFELLIGEDCSDDDTRSIAMRYQRDHPSLIRVISADRNVGMHRNHRRLVELSRGEYLAYCEGDDYWTGNGKLAAQIAFLVSRPSYGAVHTEFSHIRQLDGRWRALPRFQQHHRGQIPDGDVFRRLLSGNFIQTCTMLVRAKHVRDYFASALPTDSYRVADWPLCLFIGARSRIGYLDESMAAYRMTPGSATNRGYTAEIARALDSIRMISDFCREFGAPPEFESTGHRQAMEHVVHMALRAGDVASFELARRWFSDHAPNAFSPYRFRAQGFVVSHPILQRAYRACTEWADLRAARKAYSDDPAYPDAPGAAS